MIMSGNYFYQLAKHRENNSWKHHAYENFAYPDYA